MSGGSLELQSSNFSITNEKDDKSSKTDFVDAREDPEGLIPNIQSSSTFLVLGLQCFRDWCCSDW